MQNLRKYGKFLVKMAKRNIVKKLFSSAMLQKCSSLQRKGLWWFYNELDQEIIVIFGHNIQLSSKNLVVSRSITVASGFYSSKMSI